MVGNKKIYENQETLAHFKGGGQALDSFVNSNLRWPSEDFGSSGMVIIQFLVEKNGKLSEIEVVKKLCSFCDEEALRVVSLMPNWVPKNKDGENIRSIVQLPIRFKLKK